MNRASLLGCAAALLLTGCTTRELLPITEEPASLFDDKVKLTGRVCTEDPAELEFPLKVLFVIDTSQSMNVNDPMRTTPEPRYGETNVVDPTQATGRSRAIRQVISEYIDLGVSFPPVYCNTGATDCAKGSTSCPACSSLGEAMCVGADCCSAPPCSGTPACPSTGSTNGVCLPLCDATQPGCGPGESDCADCPNPGSRCLNGICGNQLDPGVEFALLRFGSAKQVITRDPQNGNQPGFTDDPRELVTSLPQVNNGGSVTDYEGALAEAFTLLASDMARMRDRNTGALNRSKYVVVFLSDGQPDPRVTDSEDWEALPPDLVRDLLGDQAAFAERFSEYNAGPSILRRVKDIADLKTQFRVGEVRLHTAYLSNPNTPATIQDQAISLLEQMARVGQGTFRNFANGEEINFLDVDFSTLLRVFRLKSLIVSNLNGRPDISTTITDSDGDGLSDMLEESVGTGVAALDTDRDGFSDSLEHTFRQSGADPLDPADADCNPQSNDVDEDGVPDDADGDTLLDCEERFIGTSRTSFDSDADGIPDILEVRFGTNPVTDDTLEDLDFDGMPNGDELRLHTDPRTDDARHRSRISYRYDVRRTGTGIEDVELPCTTPEDCPQGNDCLEGACSCAVTDDCSSLATCTGDEECPVAGERCISSRCTGGHSCEELTCVQRKNISCYDYSVENITLVSPRGADEDGWNTLQLYFGQVPFDNPDDEGLFVVGCVRARFNSETGAKLPARGILEVPQTSWKDPGSFDPNTDCLCPDGEFGTCGPQ